MDHGPEDSLRLFAGANTAWHRPFYSHSKNIERASQMAKVGAFHSVKLGTPRVYHNDDKCTEGNNIESYNRRSGTDGRPLCDHCRRL